MPRPEQPLDPSAGSLALLATELRKLRGQQTYMELSRKTRLAASTLNSAAGGARLPTWETTRAFTVACGGDEREIRPLWEEARAATAAARGDRVVVPDTATAVKQLMPDPASATSAAEFIDQLSMLRAWAGNPSLAELNKRAGWLDLAPSTVSDMLRRRDRLPRLGLIAAFVRACGLDDDQADAWEQAWATLRAQELLPGQPRPADAREPLTERLRTRSWARRRHFRDFLAWISGARADVLRLSPSDRPRYAGLGAAVLVTSVLAGVSGSFALRAALSTPLAAAVAIGAVWGAAILILNRFLVMTIHRRNHLSRVIPQVIPRLALALLMGVVISTPLVLQIYAPEISAEIALIHQQTADEFASHSADSAVGRQITALQQQLSVEQNLENVYYKQWQCELNGCSRTGGSSHPGDGPLARAEQQRYESVVEEAGQTRGGLTVLQRQQQQSQASFTFANQRDNGLLTRLEALDQLAAHNEIVATSRILILLLFTVIEFLPILIRMLMVIGPEDTYEQILRIQELSDIRQASRHIRAQARDDHAATSQF